MSEDLNPGGVVWVKCGSHYWPGEVKSFEDLPAHVQKDFDPKDEKPKCIVKFFDEDGYEFLDNKKGLFPYNCPQKEDFIKKGLVKSRRTSKEGSSWFAKFPHDIVRCEILTNGDPNLLEKEPYIEKNEKVNYKEIFKSNESSSTSKRKKRSSNSLASPSSSSPSSKKAKNASPSSSSNLSPSKRGKRGSSTTPSRPISHPRFKPGASGASDHKIKILPQPSTPYHLDLAVKQEKAAMAPANNYTCSICGFSASRLNVIILHNKTHSNSSASGGRSSGSPGMARGSSSNNGVESASRSVTESKKSSKKSARTPAKKAANSPAAKKPQEKKPRMTKKLKEEKAKEEEQLKVERRNKILDDWSDDGEEEDEEEAKSTKKDSFASFHSDDEEMEGFMGDDHLHQNFSDDENDVLETKAKEEEKESSDEEKKESDKDSTKCTEMDKPLTNDEKVELNNEASSSHDGVCASSHSVPASESEANVDEEKSLDSKSNSGAPFTSSPIENHYVVEDSSPSTETISQEATSIEKESVQSSDESNRSKPCSDSLDKEKVQSPHSQCNEEEEISNSTSVDEKRHEEKNAPSRQTGENADNPLLDSSEPSYVNSTSDLDVAEKVTEKKSTKESLDKEKALKNGSSSSHLDEDENAESPSSSSNSNNALGSSDIVDINKVLEETRVPSLPEDLKDISKVDLSKKKSFGMKVMQPTSNLTDPWDVQDEFMEDQEGGALKKKEREASEESAVSTTTPSEKNHHKKSPSRDSASKEQDSKNELDGRAIMAVIPNGNEDTLAVVGEDNKVLAIAGDCKGELGSTQQLLQGEEEETYILLVDDGSGTVDSLNSQTLYIDPSSLVSGDYSNMVLMTSSSSTGSSKEPSSNKDILALAIQQQQIVTTVDTTGGVAIVPGIASSSSISKVPLISTQATPSAPLMTPEVLPTQVSGPPDSTSSSANKNIQKSL